MREPARTRVLFLCTGNSARSQMAEAFLRFYAADQFEVYSAGLEPKGIHPLAVRVMQEIGLDLRGHYSKSVAEYLGKMHFGYVVTVCANAEERCPVFPGVSRRLHWAFEDPAAFSGSDEARLRKFRQVRDQIDHQIRSWLEGQGLQYHRSKPAQRLDDIEPGEGVAHLLVDIQDRLLALGQNVETMLTRSTGLLRRAAPELLEQLGEQGRQVRQLRLAIEMRCLALVAAQKPHGRSMPIPAIMIEIASDLELLGEHARQIGRADYGTLEGCFGDSLKSIDQLAEVVRSMLRQAMWAMALREVAVAEAVPGRAAGTEPQYERLHQELRNHMRRQPRFANQAIHLAHSVNQLGLAAEKVVSIANWAAFDIRGGTYVTSIV